MPSLSKFLSAEKKVFYFYFLSCQFCLLKFDSRRGTIVQHGSSLTHLAVVSMEIVCTYCECLGNGEVGQYEMHCEMIEICLLSDYFILFF